MADLFDILLGKNLSGGGVQPQGEIEITANGEFDVKDYATADVNVPNPSTGTLDITENGEYDVTEYATAKVNIQGKEFKASVDTLPTCVATFAFMPTVTVEIVE